MKNKLRMGTNRFNLVMGAVLMNYGLCNDEVVSAMIGLPVLIIGIIGLVDE